MSIRVRWLLSAAALLALSGAEAQLVDAGVPVESPIWWTLTDEVSPEMLRTEFGEGKRSLVRYRKAVEAGIEQELTEEQIAQLRFYLNPSLTPDFVPMWWAFDHLCQWWIPRDGPQETEVVLAQFSISKSGIDAVLSACGRHVARVKEGEREVAPLQAEFIRMQWEISRKLGATRESEREVASRLTGGEIDWFAKMSGKSVGEVSALLDAGRTNFVADAAAETLVELRSAVAADDWNRLKDCLLHQAAERIGVFKDF